MDANRKPTFTLNGANRNGDVIEVNRDYRDGDDLKNSQKTELTESCTELHYLRLTGEYQEAKPKQDLPAVAPDPPVQQKMEPFDICNSSSDVPLFPEVEEPIFINIGTGTDTQILRPGMVLLKNCIPLDDQVKIISLCRRLGLGEGGFYLPEVRSAKHGALMMCFGRDWDAKERRWGDRRLVDGAMPPPLPDCFISLTERAIAAAHDRINADLSEGSAADILPHTRPNVCIVNFYSICGRLSLHQDRCESKESLEKGLPVVTISLGDSAMFVYGDNKNELEKVLLESGDVLLFGGSSRLIFHAVESIISHSAPTALQQATHLRPGRLSLILREY